MKYRYQKVRNHCYYTDKYRDATHSICNLKCNVLNEVPVVFHKGSIYDDHFIIKELANEFEGEFKFLGETKKSTNLFQYQ